MRPILLCLLALLVAAPAGACFGPKLYFGTGDGERADLLFAVVSLYVKEKTGTEMVRVFLDGRDAAAELQAEKLDLALLPTDTSWRPVLLTVPGWPKLAAGPRPLEDLQFTTFSPALAKLNRLLSAEHLQTLLAQVHGGEAPMAAVRRFFAAKGWL